MKITTEVWACDSCHALIGAACPVGVQGAPEPRRVQITIRWLEGGGEARQEARDLGHLCDRCWGAVRGEAPATA